MKKCGQVDNLPEMEINTLSGRQRRRRKIKKKFQQNNKSNKNKNKKKRSFQGDWMYRRQRAPESLIFRTPLSRLDLFFGFFFSSAIVPHYASIFHADIFTAPIVVWCYTLAFPFLSLSLSLDTRHTNTLARVSLHKPQGKISRPNRFLQTLCNQLDSVRTLVDRPTKISNGKCA